MDEAPLSEGEARNLVFLRRLVTALTVTMIVGLIAIVTLLVIRFTATPPAATLELPETISLPKGETALALTKGQGWFAVVTSADKILIYDAATGDLRQTVTVTNR